jgi:hypothetical protein
VHEGTYLSFLLLLTFSDEDICTFVQGFPAISLHPAFYVHLEKKSPSKIGYAIENNDDEATYAFLDKWQQISLIFATRKIPGLYCHYFYSCI